jgi:uncharacterized protein YyaL (SSP411 family)
MPHTALPNALANETSPYLLQHAHNPVRWYPWSQEALELARHENKPILLSVGYSACHWCHVMAHESFEDDETAALMNRHFVNIKVDREERPDLDKVYQTAHYLLTQRSGGWPLTLFLTPEDQTPFFGGTYFPLVPRYGLPGFKDILLRIAEVYTAQPESIQQQNQALRETLQRMQVQPGAEDPTLSPAPLADAREQLADSFDRRLGGFGAAPKFPHPTTLERLFRHYADTRLHGIPDDAALNMALFTLRQMARGGIYDQLGGGFCRYSVDAEWRIPHFEKMLYDNGPLLALYSEAWQLSGDPLFQKTALETADWALRDMQSPEGGFYSSLDADSEGHEGKFYVWNREEVRSHLGDQEHALFTRHFGLDQPSNFEGEWHLFVSVSLEELASEFKLTQEGARTVIDQAKEKLLTVRNKRIWPGRDEKILTSWNGLMVKGLTIAARVFQRTDYLDAATRAVDFLRGTLWKDGRLLATCKDGKAHLNAYLDDYALLLDALLNLLQVRWRDADLRFAMDLADTLLAHFEDPEHGGFFFTSHDHERLIQRSKILADEALPAGTAVAALCLGRLGHLLGETRYLDACERALRAAWGSIEQFPAAYNSFLHVLEESLYPPEIVVLRGTAASLETWRQRCAGPYAPRRLSFAIPESAAALPGVLAHRVPTGKAVAYICHGTQCGAPIVSLEMLDTELRRNEVTRGS